MTPDQEALPVIDGERPVETASDTRGRLGRVASVAGLVGAALVHPIATLLARTNWCLDLVTHFREPALAVTLIAAVSLIRRHTRVALSLVCLAFVQAAPLARYGGPNPVRPAENATSRLRVLMANVCVDNTRYDALERLIRRERPDVVGLVELTPEWVAGLAVIRDEYPYRVEAPIGALGLALWFRERPRVIDPPDRPIPGTSPYLHAEFTFAGKPRHLWLVHPTMPLARKGRPELPALSAIIGRTSGSRIVIGDLNSTEGSPLFSDFVRTIGLRDSRLGFGRQPSWPADWPYRIALEHAFVSDDLAVVGRRLGPAIGSDHFPLILDLAPATGKPGVTNSTSQSGKSPGRGG